MWRLLPPKPIQNLCKDLVIKPIRFRIWIVDGIFKSALESVIVQRSGIF